MLKRVVRRLLSLVPARGRYGTELPAGEQQHRLLIEHAPAAIAMFDRQLCYLCASNRWLADYGLVGRDLRGLSHYEVFPEIPERWRKIHQRALNGEVVRAEEDPFIRASGSIQWLRWEVRPWHAHDGSVAGIVMFTEDITARKGAEIALSESKKRLEKAQQIAHLGSWERDLLKEQLTWSDETYRIFGRTREQFSVTTEAFFSQVHPEDRDAVRAAYDDSLRNGSSQYEVEHRIIRPDGALRFVHEKCKHIRDSNGQVVRSIGMVHDVTEQTLAQQAQQRLQDERLELQLQLEQAHKLESIGTLAAGLAHEFNNLLAALFGFVELAIGHLTVNKADRALKDLHRVMGAIDRARALTGYLLTFSAGGAPEKKLTDLNTVIHDLLQSTVAGTQISASLRLPDIPLMAQVDRHQVAQVFENLFLNARDAMPQGGNLIVSAGIERNTDSLPAPLKGKQCIRIAVTDTGHGIPPEHLTHVFDPFFSTKPKGFGLGLSIAHSIVKKHEGALQVQSEQGKGSTFTVFLPCAG